jgi:hypothetical protein
MSRTKKATGLGAGVFFPEKDEKQTNNTNMPTPTKKAGHYKASLNLAEDTYNALTALKVHFRKRRGKNVTFAGIIDEAVLVLLEQEGLEPEG